MRVIRFFLFFLSVATATTSVYAQLVNQWTIAGNVKSVNVGGLPGRTGVGAAVLGPRMYVAYAAANDSNGDGYNDQYVHILSTDGLSFTPDQRLNGINGPAITDANPSLTSAGGTLYLALNAGQSPSTYWGGTTTIFTSTNGIDFYLGPQPPLGIYTGYSPSLTTDPWTNDVYLGVVNAADHTLTLCRLPANTNSWTCKNFPGTTQMGFNPSLAYWNGILYVGFTLRDNSHNCDLFTSIDQGQTLQEDTTLGNDQSSSNPALVVFHNFLYYGFRSNDNAHNFVYKYSSDGWNFSGANGTNNTRLGGAPMMVDGTGLQYNSNLLWNLNSANDRSNWLWWETAQ